MMKKKYQFDIILIGEPAAAAAYKLLCGNAGELGGIYSKTYLNEGRAFLEEALEADYTKTDIIRAGLAATESFLKREEAGSFADADEAFVVQIGEEGVFRALWRLGETFGCGLRAVLKDIPIKQICIEMGDRFDMNPYLADSTGCFLALTRSGAAYRAELAAQGIASAIIGYTTADNAKAVINEGELRYLNDIY